MSNFPNRAGDWSDNDDVLEAELRAAGIAICKHRVFRESSGEVKTSVIGELYGWTFKRAWTYWVAEGPGIELEAAERLHLTHGNSVRVDGHCGCPSPGEWFNGLACGSYHIDNADGLRALAKTLTSLVERKKQSPIEELLRERLREIHAMIPPYDEVNDTHPEDFERFNAIRRLSKL